MSQRPWTVVPLAVAALLVSARVSPAQRMTSRFAVDTPAVISPIPQRGNPGTALALGIVVPGAGYLYSRQYSKAPEAFALSLGGVLSGICVYQGQCLTVNADHNDTPSRHRSLGVALGVGGAAMWLWSAFDASRAVRRNDPPDEINILLPRTPRR